MNRDVVLKLKQEGLSNADIGRWLGISRERVRQIVTGRAKRAKAARPKPVVLLRTCEAA